MGLCGSGGPVRVSKNIQQLPQKHTPQEIRSAINWVHANGGIINGGVLHASVQNGAILCIFAGFLRFFVRFSTFFPAKMACRKAESCA